MLHAFVLRSAFNNILSNLGYVMLGLLFLLIVLKRNITQNRALLRNDLNTLVRRDSSDQLNGSDGLLMHIR